MISYLKDNPVLAEHLDQLLKHDPIFKTYKIERDDIKWPAFEEEVDGLIRILIAQQISFKAVDALWVKLQLAQGLQSIIPFLKSQSIEQLKSFGFSRQKQNYLQALIDALDDGFDFKKISLQNDIEAIETIIALKGFGQWSAQIYLLFCLNRPNILPDNDLVIDKALQHIFKLNHRPDNEKRQEIGAQWEGQKTAATLILWHLQIYHFQ